MFGGPAMKLHRYVLAICLVSGWLGRAYSSDYLQKIAITSDPAPRGGFTVPFTGFYPFTQFNSAGEILFQGTTGSNGGYWLFNGTGLEFVVGDSSPIPIDVDGAFSTSSQAFDMNATGQVTVLTTLFGGTVNAMNSRIVWLYGAPGGPKLLGRSGNALAGTASGLVMSDFYYPVVDNAGQVTYTASLVQTGQTTVEAYENVVVEANGTSKLLGPHTGDHAPGFASDVTFRLIGNNGRLNILGQRTVEGYLVGGGFDSTLGNDRGLWLAGPSGDLISIAQNGLAAPGTGNGVVFSWLSQFPVLNGAGQFAFQSTVRGPGVTTSN